MLKTNKYFETNSLALASAIALFSPIVAIRKDSKKNNCIFSFEKTPEIEKIITNYWNKKLLVDALEYFEKIKILKARIYETI